MDTQSLLKAKLGDYYEERVLQGTVQEELYNIMELETPLDFAQVFFDILQCHEWIFKYPRVLHCDISQANIMFRCVDPKEQLHGVLNDFDLATIFDDPDYPTPSFNFLRDAPRTQTQDQDAPYRSWFTDSYKNVATQKRELMTFGHWNPPTRKFFQLLEIWLKRLRFALCSGIIALESKQVEMDEDEMERAEFVDSDFSTKPTFDEAMFKEMFEGRFSYDVVFAIMRKFNNVDLDIKNPEHM
ncbi:hypothetical protein GYMLUDRAFT_240443 [Collybiopsis luxurians FD-317 M1]|nr:hypothetical protein GYMLUDRAFT_240443 [Collybiopsis luxurians FD-317 M1]